MISNITPDEQKANSLMEMAVITLERLETTDIQKYPTNTLNDYYDIIHKLLEAITIKKGIKIKGEGAHQELIDYVAKKYGFDDSIRLFLQEMRDYRNRISYEGFMVNKNYIELNKGKISEIIDLLRSLLKKER